MIKPDWWIAKKAQEGMITPFVPRLVRTVDKDTFLEKVISFGLSSTGYDVRLSPVEFKIFRHIPGTIINPKRFNPANLEAVELHSSDDGQYFVLPAHSYGLCVTKERVAMPPNITGLLLNKSTMVRCGIVLPATVIEPGFVGHITIEISNSSDADVMLFANEGIAQLLFFEGEPCEVSYEKRQGKYQDQEERVTLAKV
jgi:dCTP deaminase